MKYVRFLIYLRAFIGVADQMVETLILEKQVSSRPTNNIYLVKSDCLYYNTITL